MSAILNDARRLADFMVSLDVHSQTHSIRRSSAYNHLGALLADIVLQSGLNYRTVVLPRVKKLLDDFPYASTTPLIKSAIKVYGIERFLNWSDTIKTERFLGVLDFCQQHGLEDENQLRHFLIKEWNKEKFLEVKGVGPKTADYALKLMGVETIAVDRHVYLFVRKAGIEVKEYRRTKTIVEYAADLLDLSRLGVDSFIWSLMSKSSQSTQTALSF